MKIFLDANIIIDFLDEKREAHNLAKSFLIQAIERGDEILISEDILTTVYYVCQKAVAHKKLLDFLETLVEEFDIVSFGKQNIQKAIGLCRKNKNFDFEDALQAVCAKNKQCDLIVTNDKSFPCIGVPVKSLQDISNDFKKT